MSDTGPIGEGKEKQVMLISKAYVTQTVRVSTAVPPKLASGIIWWVRCQNQSTAIYLNCQNLLNKNLKSRLDLLI